jgi:RimJ/RimL family protein N-acetyltransferase
MSDHRNHLGQPVGAPLPHWQPRPLPPRTPLAGAYCRLEALDLEAHVADLWDAYAEDRDGRNWTYLPYGPFDSLAAFRDQVRRAFLGDDPLFHAIVDATTDRAVGVAALCRIDARLGVIEVGHLNYSPRLQRTRGATEAMYLLMGRVFDELGYRRYEWKCDSLNAPSRAAAQRLGFCFEGVFRQATVYKERSRDTAWFSIVDSEWPALKAAFEPWLDPANFDATGQQCQRLSDLTSAALAPLRGPR